VPLQPATATPDVRHISAPNLSDSSALPRSIVMTERVDYWKSDDRSIPVRILGISEVHDGVITAWRDYFDGNEFMSQLDLQA
jgi:limonene-1,2-epoxide hydrolase